MKKVLMILFILLLSGCKSVSNDSSQYEELVYTYFSTNECTVSNDTIKVVVRSDMSYLNMVAIGNLMLEEIDSDMVLKIYKDSNLIPTVILTSENETVTGIIIKE